MGPQSNSTSTNVLEGIHGLHVVPRSPFALQEVTRRGDSLMSTGTNSDFGWSQHLSVKRVWQQMPNYLRPIHCSCSHGDQTLMERVANVATSLPFIALGLSTSRKNPKTKLYANSLIGVGVASSLYHSSSGNARRYLRWADYMMIATASVCLSRAISNENPKLLTAATAVLLPIQPMMVSAVHTGRMEVEFARRASKDPELRTAHNLHKLSSILGGALFIADDIFPNTPYLHAAWHLAAALGVGTCNKLLE